MFRRSLFRVLCLMVFLLVLVGTFTPAAAQEDEATPEAAPVMGVVESATQAVPENVVPVESAETPAIVVNVPPENNEGFSTEMILAVVLAVVAIVQFVYITATKNHNVIDIATALSSSHEFQTLLNKLADSVPKDALKIFYDGAYLVARGAGAVENLAGMAVNATARDGAEGYREFELPIPDGVSIQEAQQAALDAIAALGNKKKVPTP